MDSNQGFIPPNSNFPNQQPQQNLSQPAAAKASGKGRSLIASIVAGAIGALVVVAISGLVSGATSGSTTSGDTVVSRGNGTITITGNDEATLAQAVAAKCLESTCTVYVYSSGGSDWSQYFGGSSGSSSQPSALGSGVIIQSNSKGSYALTNYHVVEGASKVTVKLNDGNVVDGQIVGTDDKTDLAVIKSSTGNLTAMEWGDSSEVTVGEWVMAIGSPYGYEQTVTTGIVSAMYRSDTLANSNGTSYTTYTDMIQTDAAINPGNSGGALVNGKGELIGINTYISSTSQSSAGLGFAIPSNTAYQVAMKLMDDGTIDHAYLGITMEDSLDPAGALVTSVLSGTAAEAAGLQEGDVITKVGSTTISNAGDVSAAILKLSAGDKVTITYVRNGSTKTADTTLGSADDIERSSGGNSSNSGDEGYGYGYGLDDLFDMFGYGFGMGGR